MTDDERKTAKEIRWLKKCFRCLKDFKVTFMAKKLGTRRCDYLQAGCTWSTFPRRNGNIASYGQNRTPCDYALHEMLHLAFAEFRTVRGGKTRRTFEETLIQDICKVYRQARSHKA